MTAAEATRLKIRAERLGLDPRRAAFLAHLVESGRLSEGRPLRWIGDAGEDARSLSRRILAALGREW